MPTIRITDGSPMRIEYEGKNGYKSTLECPDESCKDLMWEITSCEEKKGEEVKNRPFGMKQRGSLHYEVEIKLEGKKTQG